MISRSFIAGALFGLAQVLASGCDRPSVQPAAPSPIPPPLAVLPTAPVDFVYGPGYSLTGVSLAGVVYELTSTGRSPIEGASVYCDACGAYGHSGTKTDGNGYYSFSGNLASGGGIWLSSGLTRLIVSKPGYRDPPDLPALSIRVTDPSGFREVAIQGDTRFDILLVRQ